MKDIGKHDNVIQIFGCCTKSRPVCLVLEYAPGGNLLNYLRALKRQVITRAKSSIICIRFAGFDDVFVSQIIFITMHACTIELNITGKLPSGKHTQTCLKPNFTSIHACLEVKSRNFACCHANYTRFP